MAAPPHIEEHAVLRDGRRVLLRPLTLADEPAYRDLVRTLSPRSQYYRFFSPRRDLSDREVDHFLRLDYVDRVALIAVHDEEIIAVARYDRDLAEPDVAEVAFVVRDDFQGLGIAPRLLRLLARLALRRGMERLRATVLPDNVHMLKVLAGSGWVTGRQLDGGTVVVTLDIDRPEVRGLPDDRLPPA